MANLEAELRYQRDLLRTIADNASSALVMTDSAGLVTFVNSAAERMTGYAAEELLGRGLHATIHHSRLDGSPYPMDSCSQASGIAQGKPFEGRDHYIRKDGSFFPVCFSIAPIEREGALTGAVIEFRDMTADDERERKLEATREQFRTFYNLATVGLVQSDPVSGRMTRVNREFCEMTGYAEEELLSKTFQEITHPEDRARNWSSFQESYQEKPGPYRVEKRYTRKDGSAVWASVSALVLRDAGGAPYRTLGVIQDITTERENRARIEGLLAELRAAVQLRDEFLSVASHELKTPLTALILTLQLAQRELPAVVAPNLDTAIRQSVRLVDMVDLLLDLSRLRSSSLDIDPEPMDLRALLSELAARMRPQAESVGSRLDFIDGQRVRAAVDPIRLEQILTNLLSNAIKYGLGKPIELKLSSDGTQARIDVRDQGIGIAEEDQRRIFDRFERATVEKRNQSMGLGLYITAQLVKAHGGSIDVSSLKGQGSTFTIRLPLEASE